MRFTYSGSDAGLLQAVAFANQLASVQSFWDTIAAHTAFTHTQRAPADIAGRMRACAQPVAVQLYRPLNPLSSVVAVTDPGRPFLILYNRRRLGNSAAEKTNTLVHEFVHNVDFFADPAGPGSWDFTHPFEDTDDRPRSAPYWIGALAQRFYEDARPGAAGAPPAAPEELAFACDVAAVADEQIDDESGPPA